MEAQPRILGLDHVQLTAPKGCEEQIRAFYGSLLRLREIPKPAVLAGRGGAWFACGDQYLHVGVEDAFEPQRKAHPGLLVGDLEAMRARLQGASIPLSEDVPIPGYARFATHDPFGNRLEFLQRVAATPPSDEAEAIKRRVREAFGRSAEAYVTSTGHAAGDDLARLVELAAPRPSDYALDVSTGGGHTALAVARRAGRVVASDLTPEMLASARRFIGQQGITNVEFVLADAERLPFLDATFSLVTVRIAPHHYADVQTAVREIARVLRPDGQLLVIDNIAPEDNELDHAVNVWEQRRDPSHVRAYTASEWRAFLASAGMRTTHFEIGRKTYDFASWAERAQMPDADREALAADMLAAPERVREYFDVTTDGGRVKTWSAEYVLAQAVK